MRQCRLVSTGIIVGLAACAPDPGATEPPGNPSLAKAAESYRVVDLGTLGGGAYALAINASGEIVGASTTPTGETHAFLWSRGAMTDLGTLGGASSQAIAINATGVVVGVSTTASGKNHAFLWRQGDLTDLGTIDDRSSAALDINTRGQVVGGADGIPVVWEQGSIELLPLPSGATGCAASENNASGRAVGQCDINGIARAVMWDRGDVSDLGTLGGALATPTGMNASGAVVGISWLGGNNGVHPFLWEHGTMTDLSERGVPPGLIPNAINDRGQIAGHYGGGDQIHAVLWTGGEAIDLSSPGVDNYVSDVNASGDVVGYTVGTNGYHAVLWTRN